MYVSKLSAIFLAISLSLIGPTVHAGGGSVMGNGGATEITQILNNGQLAAQVGKQAQTVSQLVLSYQTQLSQLQQQILSGTNLGGVTLGDVMKTKSMYDQYQGSLKSVGRDLSSLSNVFDTRMVEARLRNMSMNDYILMEKAKIDQGDAAARARLARERAMVEQTQSDMAITQKYGADIGQTVGEHEAIALLNRQMNLMLQQNARILTLMGEAQNSDQAEKANKEQVMQAEQSEIGKSILDQQSKQKAAERAAIEALKAKR